MDLEYYKICFSTVLVCRIKLNVTHTLELIELSGEVAWGLKKLALVPVNPDNAKNFEKILK
jgi:hypothetical protein